MPKAKTKTEIQTGEYSLLIIEVATSGLNPRVYWESLERMGIEQEHDYVFENLANDLKGF